MYVSAHRVRTQLGIEGINAFLYMHGYVWSMAPSPDDVPGTLVNSLLAVDEVGGNLVRSYLDITTTDDRIFWPQIRPWFIQFVGEMQRERFPWQRHVGLCLFRVDMDQALARQWRHEIAALYRACEIVHPVQFW